MEFKGHTAYFTTYQVRRSIVLAQDVIIADVLVGPSDATEVTIYTVAMAANYLTAGKHIQINLQGIFDSVAGANGVLTFKLKYAGSTVVTVATIAGANTASPWELNFDTTCRAIGSGTSGKLISMGTFDEGTTALSTSRVAGALTNIDTTVVNSITVTAQYASSNASNALTMQQGHTICIDANT